MAYTLKLNIYNFSLYRITSAIEHQMRGVMRIKYEKERYRLRISVKHER